MNKKKKKGFKWVIVFLVLLVTTFTVSMVACGLFKEKQEKAAQEESVEEFEEAYIEETSSDSSEKVSGIQNENSIDFNLDALPDTVEPGGMCVFEGALYVTDSYSKCVWKVTESGAEIFAGADSEKDAYDKPQGGYNDADPAQALFKLPWDVSAYGAGIAVSDTDNGVIRIVSADKVETVLNSSGDSESFEFPTGMASDENGNLFVSDTHANSIKVITSGGDIITLLDDLNCPMGLGYNSGFLYIAETGNNRILRVNVSDASSKKSSGDIEVVAGSGTEGFTDGDASAATFSSPKAVAVANDGTVFVADTVNGAVRRISDGQVTTVEVKDEKIPDAELVSPMGMCMQGGRLYIADSFGKKIFVIE
ncbi:Sugar lactone lactonase YvrE [Butyrivibrio sp. ob235]|uniref:NHL domain-containing protein n=1 Tax=Butyrivibrio sp. ob235 TaxID=1761780 RepID=UPI0008AC641E|nr:hypothetical protein [Butyrivibrio sp. ob235]SEL65287.1 Sugar lactone lactonase YvrE [Butyrivibrio sp. ob235]